MMQTAYTAVVGVNTAEGDRQVHILTVVEDEKLPQVAEMIMQAFGKHFEETLRKSTFDTASRNRNQAALEAYEKAVAQKDWLEAVHAYGKGKGEKYHFRFVPVKDNPEDMDVVEAVVRQGWAAKNYEMPAGPEKEALQQAIEEERWEDALLGLAQLNPDNL